MRACVRACVCMLIHVLMCVSKYVSLCMCVCMHVYTYIVTENQSYIPATCEQVSLHYQSSVGPFEIFLSALAFCTLTKSHMTYQPDACVYTVAVYTSHCLILLLYYKQ